MLYVESWNIPGDLNMAIDIELGELSFELKEPILRIYTWERPTLSIGRHQRIEKLNLDFLKEIDGECVRRPTGGRAVLHFQDLTYSVVFPKGLQEFNLGVMELYKNISGIFKKAFEMLSYKVEMSKGRGSLKNPSCFSSSARYELLIDGRKFMGSAQARMKNFVLQHGSILLYRKEKMMKAVFGKELNLESMVGIFEVMDVGVRNLVESIKEAFKERYGVFGMDFGEFLELIEKSKRRRRSFRCQN